MARPWKPDDFDAAFEHFICQGFLASPEFQVGGKGYYRRYRSRYKECMRRFAALAPENPVDVLDIGVGQLALLAKKLWADRAVVADLPGPHLSYLADQGVEAISWDLCKHEPPFINRFDFVFFSEVIEHLPIPGYIVLERLRRALRPGGVMICTTPNLYRLRNVVFMALGRRIFDYFRYVDPKSDAEGLSHVLEYSRDHLDWQMKRAGFTKCSVEYCHMHHSPTSPLHRPLAWLGYPLHLVPRWRDNLVATAYAPTSTV
jgi:SAM-dependent methyltransferase